MSQQQATPGNFRCFSGFHCRELLTRRFRKRFLLETCPETGAGKLRPVPGADPTTDEKPPDIFSHRSAGEGQMSHKLQLRRSLWQMRAAAVPALLAAGAS